MRECDTVLRGQLHGLAGMGDRLRLMLIARSPDGAAVDLGVGHRDVSMGAGVGRASAQRLGQQLDRRGRFFGSIGNDHRNSAQQVVVGVQISRRLVARAFDLRLVQRRRKSRNAFSVMLSWNSKTSSIAPSNRFAHRWLRVAASISCPEMRTLFPPRRTLPSST